MLEPIKNGLRFARDPIAFLSACHRDHGDYHLARLGNKTVHLIFDPGAARSVLGDPVAFRKTRFVYDKIKPITGPTGLVQIEGEHGLKLRQAFNRFFDQASIDRYLASAREVVEADAPGFGGAHDVRGPATEMVLRTALSMFAGQAPQVDTAELSQSFLRLNDLCAREFKNLLPVGNPLRRIQIGFARRRLDRALAGAVAGEPDPASLIQSVREASGQIPHEVTAQFLLNQVKTFLFAGHETTATYLIMALRELSLDPQLQDRVRHEVTGGDGRTEATDAFLREILRLYSPAWMIVRESTAGGSVAGHPCSAGDYLFIGVHQIHRHRGHWQHPDSLSLANHAGKNAAFLPYGSGKRHCIGSRLADLELRMILGILLARYRLKPIGGRDPIRQKVMITSYPAEPVTIEFSKR